MNRYKLPDLPYDYSALEPHISGKIMELHHSKHHAGYVKSANAVLEQLDEARRKELNGRRAALIQRALSSGEGWRLDEQQWTDVVRHTRRYADGLPVLAGIQLPETSEVIRRSTDGTP